MFSAGEPSTFHLPLGFEQVCLCHGMCELLAVAELEECTLRLWRTELSLGDHLGCPGHGNNCLGSALGPECPHLEKGLQLVLN